MTVYARIHNLSEGGLFLRTSTPLSLGSKAVVRFGEPGIEATAMVVWSRGAESQGGPAGMGLQFVEVDESRKDLIRRLVERELQGNRPKSKQP